jgi:monofunctional biosynthetic peptidoglycan transglycosylase
MRKVFRTLSLVLLGMIVGLILYEGVMFIRVWHLRNANPDSTSLIDARADESRAAGQQPKREQAWVPLDKISTNLQRAVLAGEDTNFVTHHGFDYAALQKAWDEGMREAAKQAKQEGEDDDWLPTLPDFKRGASTISQQLAKNMYLSSRRSFFRKGQEALLTVFLERTLTKRRILELYLNEIEWGDGIYGAEAAAQHYFHKPASALSANEGAFLSAMIPNPRTVFNPQVNPRRVSRRQRIILRGMPYIRLP